MNLAQLEQPTEFLDRLTKLYSNISKWVKSRNFQTIHSKMVLNEEAYGKYKVEKLFILKQDGKQIGELLPVGASVIGAMGRVDLIGSVDQEILVFLDKGGPCITTSIGIGNHTESHTKCLYRGVNEAGWYWIESRKLSRVSKLDEVLFLNLLTEVSDYECR